MDTNFNAIEDIICGNCYNIQFKKNENICTENCYFSFTFYTFDKKNIMFGVYECNKCGGTSDTICCEVKR